MKTLYITKRDNFRLIELEDGSFKQVRHMVQITSKDFVEFYDTRYECTWSGKVARKRLKAFRDVDIRAVRARYKADRIILGI